MKEERIEEERRERERNEDRGMKEERRGREGEEWMCGGMWDVECGWREVV